MSWLKKLGEAVKAGAGLVPIYGNLIASLIPGDKDDRAVVRVADALSQIEGVIGYAEIFGAALGLPGAQKLQGSAKAVAQIILRSSLLAGRKVKDQARFQAAVVGLASNIAEILSSVEEG